MGTEITLDIAGISIDWAKNHPGNDHGSLFHKDDLGYFVSDQTDDDVDENVEGASFAEQAAFVRTLKDALPRLDLLGFTIETVRREYILSARNWYLERKELAKEFSDDGLFPKPVRPFRFVEFLDFIREIKISELSDTFISSIDHEDSEIMGRFSDESLKLRIPNYDPTDTNAWSELSYFGSLIGFLHPYAILRLLAENTDNHSAPIVWQFGPLVENGWADAADFVGGPKREQTFLIATEGSSDTKILKRAIEILKPEVADFFNFIDVTESHPFPGTGNLVRFASGLAKIDIQNKTIFLLDNDAEGLSALSKINEMKLPQNMRVIKLPDRDCFQHFSTIGPEGEATADINGRAAAIECYLDLTAKGLPVPRVRWSIYKEDIGGYQGALEQKDAFAKKFFKAAVKDDNYDLSGLSALLEHLLDACTEMAFSLRCDG
ncbi:hypothetical protein JCM17844_17890 [Iodidimonas gelatinilytica]|uniref:HEPN/Toprim N-terminal domain-containing protein n=1 Tax=Iodidimonas gelatinilytica TaxID=1236966 RepID=A0A5A7MQ48_9PROT|nr:HEPN/Toprim-associated domain-containing protein [Iodidimonas gelatinilytica]GEQ98152.1 hypothetical protein JCM17844_17890 [Iodidimonas gelatinilytica]